MWTPIQVFISNCRPTYDALGLTWDQFMLYLHYQHIPSMQSLHVETGSRSLLNLAMYSYSYSLSYSHSYSYDTHIHTHIHIQKWSKYIFVYISYSNGNIKVLVLFLYTFDKLFFFIFRNAMYHAFL